MPAKLRRWLLEAVTDSALDIQRRVERDKLTGQVLHVRTGTLRRSISMKVESSGTKVLGIVGTNVGYGAAWEFGFNRKVGAGARGGKVTASQLAKHPPGTKYMAPRSFLGSALTDALPSVRDRIQEAIREGLSKEIGR